MRRFKLALAFLAAFMFGAVLGDIVGSTIREHAAYGPADY